MWEPALAGLHPQRKRTQPFWTGGALFLIAYNLRMATRRTKNSPTIEHVDVQVGASVVTQRIEVWNVEVRGGDKGQHAATIRYFIPGTEVREHLVDQLIADTKNGAKQARIQLATYLVAGYLKQPTYRFITAITLFKARSSHSKDDPGLVTRLRDAPPLVDRAVEGKLPNVLEDEDLETTLMTSLVELTPSQAKRMLPQVERARRTLLEHVWPADRKTYPLGLTAPGTTSASFERAARHRIRALIREKLGGNGTLQRLTALRLISDGQELIDRANQMTLDALVREGRIPPEEQRAYRFWHLKRRRPVRPTSGVWFDGIIWDTPYLHSLLWLSPAVHHRLIHTAFQRAWPAEHLATAQADLRCHLEALLEVGRMLLATVREAGQARMAESADPSGRAYVRATQKRRQLAITVANVRHVTKRQRKAAQLRLQGRSTKDVAKIMKISRQAVEKLIDTAWERVRLRSRGFGGTQQH